VLTDTVYHIYKTVNESTSIILNIKNWRHQQIEHTEFILQCKPKSRDFSSIKIVLITLK